MHAQPPTLLDLQRAIGRSLLHGVDDDVSALVVADGLAPRARLAIYRNTATGTLVTALRLTYPAVHALVGAEFFEGAAGLFSEDSPPRSAWLDAYGEAFAEFLARLPQAASLAYLPDVARLEWAVGAVLHAADVPPLARERLTRLEAAKSGEVCFTPHPAVRLLQSRFPVDAIWRAVLHHDDNAMAAIDLSAGPVWLWVRRSASGVEIDRFAEYQWRFTAALMDGRPLHAALKEAPSAEAHVWLATLLAAGCFTEVRLAGQESDSSMRSTQS
ncbi:HvfC/BufC family peptide modification chaperone [Cupriavidus necator]